MGDEFEIIVPKPKAEPAKMRLKYEVDTFEVFGSFVGHEQGAESDLDIVVTTRESPSL